VPTKGNVATAGALGLTAGLLLGGVGLSVASLRLATRPCELPDTEECAVELASNHELSRLGALAGAGLCLIGAGGLVWLRRRGKERP